MTLESPITHTQKSPEDLFTYLSNVANFKNIMPSSLDKFEIINDTSFLFQLKGMPEIQLEIKEKNPFHTLILGSRSEKLPFTLRANIQESGDGSDVQLHFEGEFNSMMAMMIKKPIKNFIGALSENMATV